MSNNIENNMEMSYHDEIKEQTSILDNNMQNS